MIFFGGIESHCVDSISVRKGLPQRLHRGIGAQMTEQAKDQARRDAKLTLAILQGAPDAVEDGIECDPALGVSLRIEEDLDMGDPEGARSMLEEVLSEALAGDV